MKIGHPSNSINKCGGDFLRVTDGGCSDANNHPYTTYCGVEKPKDAYISTKNKICLKFVSDEAKTNKGYSVKYTEIEEYKNEGRFVGKFFFIKIYDHTIGFNNKLFVYSS